MRERNATSRESTISITKRFMPNVTLRLLNALRSVISLFRNGYKYDNNVILEGKMHFGQPDISPDDWTLWLSPFQSAR